MGEGFHPAWCPWVGEPMVSVVPSLLPLPVAGGLQLLPVPWSFVFSAEPLSATAHLLWCLHLPLVCGHSPAGPEGGAAV